MNVFDKRWLEWNGNPNQVPTRDKKYIWVETYARWRIANPLLFFQRLRDERGAQSRLDDIIDGETRNVIANHNLIEVVRVSNRAFERAEEVEDVMEAEAMRQVELGRDKITRLILERASQVMPDYGIELVDVQIQRVNYIETRAGQGVRAHDLRAQAHRRPPPLGGAGQERRDPRQEGARAQGDRVRGLPQDPGDHGRAATPRRPAIYADAYDRDRELYRFLRTMETYRATIDKQSWLMLSTGADLFRYLQSPSGPPRRARGAEALMAGEPSPIPTPSWACRARATQRRSAPPIGRSWRATTPIATRAIRWRSWPARAWRRSTAPTSCSPIRAPRRLRRRRATIRASRRARRARDGQAVRQGRGPAAGAAARSANGRRDRAGPGPARAGSRGGARQHPRAAPGRDCGHRRGGPPRLAVRRRRRS